MKKYILLLLSIVLLISCNSNINTNTNTNSNSNSNSNSNTSDNTVVYDTKDKNCPYHSIIIDSCEYIHRSEGPRGYLVHKGNCRFCKQRELDYYD